MRAESASLDPGHRRLRHPGPPGHLGPATVARGHRASGAGKDTPRDRHPRWALRRVGSYEALDGAAEEIPVGDFTVRVASIDDLIRLARTAEEAALLRVLREELDG